MNRVRLLLAMLLAASSWTWPTGSAHDVVGPYVAPAHRYAAGHRGIDIAAAKDGPVSAAAAGTVYFAGSVVDRPIVTIRLDDGTLVSAEPVVAAVAEGDVVAQGQLIGHVGSGGHCSERCVHLGVRVEGDYVSPLRFLGGIERAVLLPLN
ncbi:M23 family metallopeptidase [Microbacteriaceae bacterium VKM Ac-2854]|nr:M23 family metallopeptidase [Microbacteriaceae bacterium VKM Ac-2854]